MRLLLDTHVWLGWVEGTGKLARRQSSALRRLSPERPGLLATITFWEVAMLVSRGRVGLDRPIGEWLTAATRSATIKVCELTPAIANEVAMLPSWFHGDPVDRIIVATARVYGATLVTKDQRIIDAKVVPTL